MTRPACGRLLHERGPSRRLRSAREAPGHVRWNANSDRSGSASITIPGSSATRRRASSVSAPHSRRSRRENAAAPNSFTDSQTRSPRKSARQLRDRAGWDRRNPPDAASPAGSRRSPRAPRAAPRRRAPAARPGAVGQEHPLVRIERQRVGARQAAQRAAQILGQVEERARRRRRCDATAPRSRTHRRMASSGSTAPVFVGCRRWRRRRTGSARRGDRRRSPARADRRACGKARASEAIGAHAISGMTPASFADFSTEWCA